MRTVSKVATPNRLKGRFFVALVPALALRLLSRWTRWVWPLRLANDLLARFVLRGK